MYKPVKWFPQLNRAQPPRQSVAPRTPPPAVTLRPPAVVTPPPAVLRPPVISKTPNR